MKIKTDLEIKHFTQYLNHFHNLRVIDKTFQNNNWHVKLNDDTIYIMDLLTWEHVQSNVTKLKKETVQ